MQKQMLPGLFINNSNQGEASTYLKSIYKKPMYNLHKNYFKNYVNHGYPVINRHIKDSYTKYVLSHLWTKEKYDLILYILISNEMTLSNNAFTNLSNQYEDGSIKLLKSYADYHNQSIENDTSSDMTDDDLIKFLAGGK